ncbi:hypothetical protein TNCV_4673001 [Trichonephila clavipes]|nr:hypothetical protein TNCV_4673001 [Trichonephila clavipes]
MDFSSQLMIMASKLVPKYFKTCQHENIDNLLLDKSGYILLKLTVGTKVQKPLKSSLRKKQKPPYKMYSYKRCNTCVNQIIQQEDITEMSPRYPQRKKNVELTSPVIEVANVLWKWNHRKIQLKLPYRPLICNTFSVLVQISVPFIPFTVSPSVAFIFTTDALPDRFLSETDPVHGTIGLKVLSLMHLGLFHLAISAKMHLPQGNEILQRNKIPRWLLFAFWKIPFTSCCAHLTKTDKYFENDA